MLVYLSFLVCTASGVACHVAIPVERSFVGQFACQVGGMIMAADWEAQHSGWVVKRIRCSIGNKPTDEVRT